MKSALTRVIITATLALAASACATAGTPRRAAHQRYIGPTRVVDAEELRMSGLPNTGDALRRRVPVLSYAAGR